MGKLPLSFRTVSATVNPLTVRLSLTLRVRVPRNVPGVPMLHAGLAAGGQPPRGCEGQRGGARLEPGGVDFLAVRVSTRNETTLNVREINIHMSCDTNI